MSQVERRGDKLQCVAVVAPGRVDARQPQHALDVPWIDPDGVPEAVAGRLVSAQRQQQPAPGHMDPGVVREGGDRLVAEGQGFVGRRLGQSVDPLQPVGGP